MHARLSVALATLIALASTALATPREDLASANKAFREGQFLEARDKYNYLLYPKAQLADTNDLVEARKDALRCSLDLDRASRSRFQASSSVTIWGWIVGELESTSRMLPVS